MKFDKEYPATHSMDTAWYLADADGNVAIIDYNDNGPVPWGTEENCIENLVFGRTDELINEEQIQINLTDDQLDLLLQDPHTPKEEEYWTCIVQIDPSREDEYLMLAKKEGFLENICLSKKRGLYYISSIESTYPTKQGKWVLYKKSLIRKMISEGIIQKVYREPNYPLSDDLLENGIEPIPFFVYAEEYQQTLQQKRVHVPSNPVKLGQFSETLQNRIPRLPILFAEKENIQVAEWIPSSVNYYDDDTDPIIDGNQYVLMTLTDGTEAYVKTDFVFQPFYDTCSEREKYHCENGKCIFTLCESSYGDCFTDTPTVLIATYPFSSRDYSLVTTSDIVVKRSIVVPLMEFVPFEPHGKYRTTDELNKIITPDIIQKLFSKNTHGFEEVVTRFLPNVIIADKLSLALLRKQYECRDRNIIICGEPYPLYSMEDLNHLHDELLELALRPYRGRISPQVISIEEMKRMQNG